MEAINSALIAAFSAILDTDDRERQLAEEQLTALEVIEAFPLALVNMIVQESAAQPIRKLANSTLERYVATHWSPTTCAYFKPPQPSDEVRRHIVMTLLKTTQSRVHTIRSASALTLTYIMMHDWFGVWPMVSSFLQEKFEDLASEGTENIMGKLASIHGISRILIEICLHIEVDDLPDISIQLIRQFVPLLASSTQQEFDDNSRYHILLVLEKLLHIVLCCETAAKSLLEMDAIVRSLIDTLYVTLRPRQNGFSNSDIAVDNLVLQVLAKLLLLSPELVKKYFNSDNLHVLSSAIIDLLVRRTHDFVAQKVLSGGADDPRSDAPLHVSLKPALLIDSDYPDLDRLLCNLLHVISRLARSGHLTDHLTDQRCLDRLCQLLASLVQLTQATVDRWMSDEKEFCLGESADLVSDLAVRLAAISLLHELSSMGLPAWPSAIGTALAQMLTSSDNTLCSAAPSQWRQLEAGLYLYGSFADHFTSLLPATSPGGAVTWDTFFTHYLQPGVQQRDLPFLQVTSVYCTTQLVLSRLPLGLTLSDLVDIFIVCLARDQVFPVHHFVSRAITDSYTALHELHHPTGDGQWGGSLTTVQLTEMTSGVLDCLAKSGSSHLDTGLRALSCLLHIDPVGFTPTVVTPVVMVLLELLKNSVFSSKSLRYLSDVLHCLLFCTRPDNQLTGLQKSSSLLVEPVGNFVSSVLEQPGSVHVRVLHASLQVLCIFIRCSASPALDSFLMHRAFPAVLHLAITGTDVTILSDCVDVFRCYLAIFLDQVLEWHDDEGSNGITYMLHVASRLLDPSEPVEWGGPTGRLVSGLVSRLMTFNQFGGRIDLLLRETFTRLFAVPLDSDGLPDPELTYLERSQITQARHHLVFVFVHLFQLRPQLAIAFVSGVPDITGRPALARILQLWSVCQPAYQRQPHSYAGMVSVLAICNLLKHLCMSMDPGLMQLTAPLADEVGVSGGAEHVGCVENAGEEVQFFPTIPLVVTLYKQLLRYCAVVLSTPKGGESMERLDVEEGSFDHQRDWSVDEAFGSDLELYYSPFSQSKFDWEAADNDPIRSNDPINLVDVKVQLTNFLEVFCEHPIFPEFSRYHSSLELSTLQEANLVPGQIEEPNLC